jgi:hypothetical protein
MSGIPIWVWCCDALGVTAVVCLLPLGRRRRVGKEQYCRQCGYLLRGLESKRCPECGAHLIDRNIAQGEVTRRWWAIITACLILPLSAVLTATLRRDQTPIPIVRLPLPAPVHFYVNPDPYAGMSNASVLKLLKSNKQTEVESAWTELTKRDWAGQLSHEERQNLVEFALAQERRSGSRYTYFDQQLLTYVGHWAYVGDLPQNQVKELYQRAVAAQLEVRNQTISDVPIPNADVIGFEVHIPGPGPNNGPYLVRLNTPAVYIDGTQVSMPMEPDFGSTGFNNLRMFPNCNYPAQTIGKHQLDVTLRVRVYTGNTNSPILYDANQHLTGGFELLRKIPTDSIVPIFDPNIAGAVRAAIGPPRISKGGDYNLDGDIRVNNPPASMAYDVYVRYRGREFRITQFAWEPGDGDCDFSLSCHLQMPVTNIIDVILRPAAFAATESSKKHNYWNQEITFHDVPVT